MDYLAEGAVMTFLIIIAALIVSVAPALIVGYGAARLVRGFGPDAVDASVILFAVGFVVTYGSSVYALIVWWM